MAKLTAQGYELLDSGRYVLEVVEAEVVNEYGPQLRLKLRDAHPFLEVSYLSYSGAAGVTPISKTT